jgi:signal transduction histidine kinase
MAAARLAPVTAREQDPELDKQAALLDQSYYQLLRVVNSLSLAEHLVSDEPLPVQDKDIVDLVSTLCEQAASLAPLLGLEVRFICPFERHICALAPEALEQIIGHLLSNAFKFTPSGGVVTVEMKRFQQRILLTVTDTGQGIPQDRIDTIFDRYVHRNPFDPKPHDLGLGLPLCRRLAEGQGGSLMVESREGKGTRFTLSLPDRLSGRQVNDMAMDYSGGFNRTLLALADALPAKAFLLRSQK